MINIHIKNLGPIVSAQLDINKLNVIMGAQSSGKSTIVKTVCFCQWLEKHLTLEERFEKYDEGTKMVDEFIAYHRLSHAYFTDDTEINYTGESLTIYYQGKLGTPVLKWTQGVDHILNRYKNSKLLYIPAERNLVSVVPDLGRYVSEYDNIMEFIYTWREARQNYSKDKGIELLDLNARAFYDKDTDRDRIQLNQSQEIDLKHSSSGFQTLVPMLSMIDYLTNKLSKSNSVKAGERTMRRLQNMAIGLSLQDFQQLKQQIENIETYQFTQFYIEEPEQNLYPKTQKELIYHLLKTIQSDHKQHRLFITTHSPYILYALNNCMLGYLVKDKCTKTINFDQSFIDPKLVSVYQIEDGVLKNIQIEDGLLGANSFDLIMKDVMDDFYTLLEYYGDDNED